MAEKGRRLLREVHGVSDDRIAVVLHGVPDRPLGDGAAEKAQFGLEGHRVLLTFGLLSPNKGIETVIAPCRRSSRRIRTRFMSCWARPIRISSRMRARPIAIG